MAGKRNEFLDNEYSDDSDHDDGYDSEAAEIRKGGNRIDYKHQQKRRKLSHSSEGSEEIIGEGVIRILDDEIQANVTHGNLRTKPGSFQSSNVPAELNGKLEDGDFKIKSAATAVGKVVERRRDKAKPTPGVIYLSSLPPYLKPSALRNILQQRGFEPINRLFLAPASKAKASSKKNSRQLYTEGWIEFASKKTARRCAESLNANIIGGKKGGFYYDDIWNMKYLRGMAWDELMAGIREERREEEGRRDEERRTIAKETQRFLEGVEEGKKVEGMKRKRKAKQQQDSHGDDADDIKRTWRQFAVKGTKDSKQRDRGQIDDDVKAVLGKIF